MPNSVNLTWYDLIMRVANKVGIVQPTPLQQQTIVYYLQDALIKIRGISEDNRVINKKVAVFDGNPPEDSLIVSLASGVTTLANGFYKYAYSYYNELMGESKIIEIPAPVELVDNTLTHIRFTLPSTLPHGINKFIVYRTKVNGNEYYKHSEHTSGGTKIDSVEDSSLTLIYDKTEFADTADLFFPTEAFIVTEIIFYDTEGNTLLSQETFSEDEFSRISRNYQFNSGESIITTEGIRKYPITLEDLKYQGAVAYTLRKTYPLKFNYSPRFNGYIKFNYSVIPEVVATNLSSSPEIAYTFAYLLTQDATISYIKSLMISEKLSDVSLQAIAVVLRTEIDEYKTTLRRYLSYIHRNVNTPIVQLHDFLNDPKMELY